MTEPTVMDMVLSELKGIRESIHNLREDVNGKFAKLSNQVSAHEQWITGHDKWAAEQVAYTRENRVKLEQHDTTLAEVSGAVRAVRWIGGAVVGAVGVIEFFLHGGHK